MAGFASTPKSTARGAAFGLAAAAFMSAAPALANDFTQDECKVVKGTATQVVKAVGKDTLSMEFRQSFLNWMGRDLQCAGPKDIIVMTENDSVAYGTIRSMLLAGSHPLSLQKAGLRVVIRSPKEASATPLPQKRSDAAPIPSVN